MANNEIEKKKLGRYEIRTRTGEVLNLNKEMVQTYLSPDATITDTEFMMFFQLCKVYGLNPYMKEAYIIKYGNAPATIVADYKVLQQVADRSGVFEGLEQGVIVENKNGEVIERQGQVISSTDTLIGGWAKVYRSDKKMPFYVSVSLKEFEARKKDGSLNAQWSSKPCFMIEKVAKAHAFRVAFPQEMQGVYIEEEMQQSQNNTTQTKMSDVKKEVEEDDIINISINDEPTEDADF